MSKTVDERVVEMRFDNKQFESDVQTSLSTLAKLKQSLNLRGASKGLENVSAAAKNCKMSGLTSAVETVKAKFSAFEVIAVTALANITNSAVNAGKRIVSALTIEPVKSGFEEYETQINAIQTILANTESKGSTLQDVNAALDELNHYADMTIYNFTEMTRNIGTFTAAGVDLDTSVSAIKGIANLAAVSGSTSQQASTAMYQLSQALAAGTVKLQDWNSVVNAGMGGQVFQDALKETARVHGIAIDQMIADEGSFRETLSEGWLTSEVLTETLSKFTGDLTEAQLKQMGYADEQVASIIKMGQTANDAATKVKTLTQLFDTLKEAAQSGWTQTWELIVGDFDQAKELFTEISDSVSNALNTSADRRNNLLEGALTTNWEKLISKINEAGIETKTFEDRLKETVSAHGMGGALVELTASLSVLSKAGGFGALLGGTGMLVAVQSLDKISQNLERLGNLSWDQIGHGLSAMGGALGEFTVALSALSAVGGFGSLLGGTGILVAVQSLDDISENLKKLGALSWEEIGRGLTAMGGALGELTASLSVLSAVGGFGSVLGATGILVSVQALDPIATALSRIGGLSWEEIGKGLIGMESALAELGITIGLLGKLTGFSSVFAGGAILLGVQGLGDLADALKKFGGISWEEIEKGLVGMGGALTELATVSGLLGNLGGFGALIGSGSILLGVQGLGDLADALKKFGTMKWDEIGRGLSAMAGALGDTALGGLLNTFSGFGAGAISKMAAPLGDLADSIKRWSGVSVPNELGTQLGSLAEGVRQFNFSGWGADAIGSLGKPLGDLAASISKWSGITVPDNIGTGLQSLAGGVKSFNFSGWGADAISELATPMGDLAVALGKWTNVTVPDNIETSLSGLASGISAWNYVETYNLASAIEPVGSFAAAVEKWNGVNISSNLQSGLEGLADGIDACDSISTGNLSSVCDGLDDIGKAVSNLAGIDFSGASSSLSGFASAISNVNVSTDTFKNLGTNIVSSFTSALTAGVGRVSMAGASLAKAVSSGMKSASSSVSSTASTITNTARANVSDKQSGFVSAGISLMAGLASGLRANAGTAVNASASAAASSSAAASAYYGSFYSSGVYLVSGFAAGIRNNISSAASAAASMAASASAAARANLKIHSPSRVFYSIGGFAGQGFVNALADYSDASYKAGSGIALSARDGLQKAISKVTESVENGLDGTPRIRPVLDLSAVEAGAGKIDGLLGMGRSIGITGNIGAISAMMSDHQNGASNDDVVSAIGKLSKVIGSKSGDSYVINGITYDDGSNITSAVKTLIRAAKVGGRV